ncbi:Hypothetical Protein CGB_L0370C [Cryptococcus gattii WM276]|uniref:Uncharacterized protein n=2 Tax=Cryptococcus gattii TaxID=37769 RepID=E6REJ6_CRYGW|nr:Hypothetical Protein CGB_L0370C [Cryptococcus gattii WM276]ADV25146.1 Hypothetical Protein CGB_L0370C [Cryptococcus gattii WM276]KIR76656.1 hypothetical protein I306_06275 [Cryptococcus gattii EJB2]
MPVAVLPPEDEDCLSFSSTALQILTQDVSSLLSLSLETTASVLHDWFRSSLGVVGLGGEFAPPRDRQKTYAEGESGRNLAVVIVGAGEATGQSLTLHLAKSGYTVFPFIPIPVSPFSTSFAGSNDTSSAPTDALSNILLTWSATRKRLCARTPDHPGAVVPIIVDPEGVSGEGQVDELGADGGEKKRTHWDEGGNGKEEEGKGKERGGGRFAHAGKTVRAYIRENGLTLVSIICVSHTPLPYLLPQGSLVNTPESTLSLAYRTNVLDPVSVVRELSDMLVSPFGGYGQEESGANDVNQASWESRGKKGKRQKSQGRVIFINPSPSPSPLYLPCSEASGSLREYGYHHRLEIGSMTNLTTSLRASTARILRDELALLGVEVCEVVVGPMWEKPRLARWGASTGGESVGRVRVRKMEREREREREKEEEEEIVDMPTPTLTLSPSTTPTTTALAVPTTSAATTSAATATSAAAPTRLLILSRLWAVDDALLFSSVRRALEDRYPRYRHYAGLGPLVDDLVGAIPGGRAMTGLGRWVVGKLLS